MSGISTDLSPNDILNNSIKEVSEGDDTQVIPPVEERKGPEGAEQETTTAVSVSTVVSSSGTDLIDGEYLNENYDSVATSFVPSSLGLLPWGVAKERSRFPSNVNIETDILPGEFVMKTLFAEFTIQASKKINALMNDPLERPLAKSLQRGEDPQFDQLLCSFGSVAEHCLPSLLMTLFAWFELQGIEFDLSDTYFKGKVDSKGKSDMIGIRSEAEFLAEKRDLAVEFIVCLVQIEVLKQLPLHPGHEELVHFIENLAFKHFRYRDSLTLGPNAANIHIVSDLYAEVLGVLAQSRFLSIKKRFFAELRELRCREPSAHTTQSIVALLMGMKFFRVKMVPFEDFELSFQFMQECAQYFLEVKDKDIKHAVAGLFVEILMPVAAAVKNEVNVPCLKNFVEKLYSHTLDMCARSKHRLAIFPLVTCLLCVSQKTFFLHNWHYFLTMCMQHLKIRDTKMARVALESLYRLLWVYMIRIKCESNNVTQSRLQSIVNSLFPKGSKAVVPRDTPLNIFVKIIQFIAQEKLDFAIKEIVFDLLSVGRAIKVINAPERMSIGLRAFLVVADSLQQKEGEPPMPRTICVMPSGSMLRVKKTFISKMLTEDVAKNIGLAPYYPYVRKVFDDILRALDTQFGRPFLLTNSQNPNKETDDAKPKLDLFRTVVAAIPRMIPDGMSRSELLDTLSRLTLHIDDELRALAYQSLQNLVVDFTDWRDDVIYGFVQFVVKDILDQNTSLLDNALRMVYQLLAAWRMAAGTEENKHFKKLDMTISTLQMVEGFALVVLCQCRLAPRRLAVHILRETKVLLSILKHGCIATAKYRSINMSVLDALDMFTTDVVLDCGNLIPTQDRSVSSGLDFQWLTEKNSPHWTAGFNDDGLAKSGSTQHLFLSDPWSACFFSFLRADRLSAKCPTALLHSWPIVYTRLTQLFNLVDPSPLTDNRASLLRPGTAPKKTLNERDIWMHLWKNYVSFGCLVVPVVSHPVVRCLSPDIVLSSSPESLGIDRDTKSPTAVIAGSPPSAFYKLLIPLLRCEAAVDMRDSVVQALGRINHIALTDLITELSMCMRESVDRKQENLRRRRRRDALRVQLVRVFEMIAEHETFSLAYASMVESNGALICSITEYIDGTRVYLESESDKDSVVARDLIVHFCSFIRLLILSFSLDRRQNLLKKELRRNLFYLFASYSPTFGASFDTQPIHKLVYPQERLKFIPYFDFSILQTMISILCCGPCFDVCSLQEDGCLYSFLDLLLGSKQDKIYNLAKETIIQLLEFNPNTSFLLDWIVDRCFTGSNRVADSCFLALVTIFAAREYPCDHYTAIINVTLMNTGCPRPLIHESAVQLLQMLDKRFFGSTNLNFATAAEEGDESKPKKPPLHGQISSEGGLLLTTYSRSQVFLSRQLAQLHPELTMPMFSEICSRLQTARPAIINNMLYYLLPWLYNMELIEANIFSDPVSYQHLDKYGNGQSKSELFGTNASRNENGTRDAWGSSEATEMITNNLFYISIKFGDDYTKEIEELWAALCACWPKNLRVIIHYLFIVIGLAPYELVEYAKRIVVYLGRALPLKTLEEIMCELQCVESFNFLVERTETPPFYRLTNYRKTSTASDSNAPLSDISPHTEEKGTIHTKRHSQEDSQSSKERLAPAPPECSRSELTLTGMASSAGSAVVARIQRVGEKVRAMSGSTPHFSAVSNNHHSKFNIRSTDAFLTSSSTQVSESNNATQNNSKASSLIQNESVSTGDEPSALQCISRTIIDTGGQNTHRGHPRPLPMPEYGGWFAPLTEFLPNSGTHTVQHFHRCNLAAILLTDLVVDGLNFECRHSVVDWAVHVPLILHIIFLGLDNARELVQRHCRQLLLNLLIVLGNHNDYLTVSSILMHNQTQQLSCDISQTRLRVKIINFTNSEKSSSISSSAITDADAKKMETDFEQLSDEVVQTSSFVNDEDDDDDVKDNHLEKNAKAVREVHYISESTDHLSISQLTKSLIYFLSSRKSIPLWQYEDATKVEWSIKSSVHLSIFLKHILRVFEASLLDDLLASRWSQLAIQLALSCSSRHNAGRSLQIFRALGVPMTPRMLTDILSRLVETISEQGEDMQGYVTELILTLESVVDSFDCISIQTFPDLTSKEIFKSTPNLKDAGLVQSFAPPPPIIYTNVGAGHVCHVSAPIDAASYAKENSEFTPTPISPLPRPITDAKGSKSSNSSLARSRSAQSLLHVQDQTSQDDKLTMLVQLFWICMAILESDYEHEFLLGLRLLERVMEKLWLDKADVRERVEKLQLQLKWPSFPGVHSLLLKGCTNPNTYECTIRMLIRLTLLLDCSVVDPSKNLAYPMNVIALLPYMVQNYEDTPDLCVQAAENIAQISTGSNKTLENLATVMTLYSRNTFSKESFHWTKCVVKYLYDIYQHYSFNMLAFLVEVLEKGPVYLQSSILTTIHCFLHYVEMTPTTHTMNADLLRSVAKFLESNHWKEALKILKLAVARSSTLAAPPAPTLGYMSYQWGEAIGPMRGSFCESDVFFKKELPGRTLEFTYDLSSTPIIGRRTGSFKRSNNKSVPFCGMLHNRPPHMASSMAGSLSGGSSNSVLNSISSCKYDSIASNVSSSLTAGSEKTESLRHFASVLSSTNSGGLDRNKVNTNFPPFNNKKELISEVADNNLASPRRSLSLAAADSNSLMGWKRPWMCQARVRERLVNLLNTCGQRIGLLKSPSVIFSQASELLERHSSMASSTEEVSATNDLSTDSRQNDTTDTEQRFRMYMRDFDFLEYELESLEGESVDNFNWGVRRQSLSHLESGAGGMGLSLRPCSSSDLVSSQQSEQGITSALPHMRPTHLARRNERRGVGEDSSDDEFGSISARSSNDGQSVASSVSTTSSVIFPPKSLPLDMNRTKRRCSTPQSETDSECSEDVEISDHDLTPCNVSPSLTHLMSGWSVQTGEEVLNGSRVSEQHDDHVEEAWRSHVQIVMASDADNETMLATFGCFVKMFEELRQKLKKLLNEAIFTLSKDNEFMCNREALLVPVVAHFRLLLANISEVICFPYVWCNFELLGGQRLIERVRFNILEIQENLENFVDKKDVTLECLDAVKSHEKLVALGEPLTEYNSEMELLDLCRCMYRLHFQLLMVLECFAKLLRLLDEARREALSDVDDVSNQISEVHKHLDIVSSRLRHESETPVRENSPTTPTTIVGDEDSMDVSLDKAEDNTSDAMVQKILEHVVLDEVVREEGETDGYSLSCSSTLERMTLRSTTFPSVIVDPPSPPKTELECEKRIVDMLNASRWNEALETFYNRRSYSTSTSDSNDTTLRIDPHAHEAEDSELDIVHNILDIYCRSLCVDVVEGGTNIKGVFADTSVAGAVGIIPVCSRLMEASVKLMSIIKKMETELRQTTTNRSKQNGSLDQPKQTPRT